MLGPLVHVLFAGQNIKTLLISQQYMVNDVLSWVLSATKDNWMIKSMPQGVTPPQDMMVEGEGGGKGRMSKHLLAIE
jgi:hypothetical protein